MSNYLRNAAILSIRCLAMEGIWPTVEDYEGFDPVLAVAIKAEEILNKADLGHVQVDTRRSKITIKHPDIKIEIPIIIDQRDREEGQFGGTLFIIPMQSIGGHAINIVTAMCATYDIEYEIIAPEQSRND